MHSEKNHMSGIYRGFHTSIQANGAQYVVRINAQSSSDINNAALGQFLLNQKDVCKQLVKTEVFPHMVTLYVKAPNLVKNTPKVLNEALMPIYTFLMNNLYISGCEHCGSQSAELNCYEINGFAHTICGECRSNVELVLTNHQQQMQVVKSKLVPGLVGAFLGALIGCALWVLIFKLGYIAGLAGAVTAICAMKGYELLGGYLDRKGVIGSTIIMVVMIFFANKLAWAWDAYAALEAYDWSFGECYQDLGYILAQTELTGSYYGDLAVGYLLTALCSAKTIIGAFNSSAGKYTIK